MRITAMDLGTSNTCIASCDDKGLSLIKPKDWYNEALGGAVPTLILYKDDAAFSIGAAAEYEFGEASDAERKRYSLHSQFKPDIAVDQHAYGWMRDFLCLLHTRVQPTGTILVGIPSQAENHYQQALRQCLSEAGWQGAQFLREPVGALLHAIASGKLPPSLAARGVLTIDFGGGTCDLAFMRRADVVARHGDMLYGGRLFDDLFYQMLLQANPTLDKELRAQGNSYYVHYVACRRAKEEFSAAIEKNLHDSITVRVRWSHFNGTKVVQHAAYIENLTWTTFLAKAGAYTASPDLLQNLKAHAHRAEISPRGKGLLEAKQVDLVAWFEDILLETLQKTRQEKISPLAQTPLVLLTGGSSAWPFVNQLVQQTLGSRAQILMSDEPYADIAKGLAQYTFLAEHLSEGRNKLQEELPTFMEERIRRIAIKRTLEKGSEELLHELETFLRDVVLIPQFEEYRDKGGSLTKLMEGIAKSMVDEESRVRELLDTAMGRMGKRIVNACRDELKQWFREKGIPIVPERLEQTWLALEMDTFITQMAHILGTATLSQDRQAAQITTMVAGPGLAALAASGAPLTAMTLGIGGLVLMKVFKLDHWVVNKVLMVPIPGPMRRKLFGEKRLQKLCTEQLEVFGKDFKNQIMEQWKASEGRVLAEASRVAGEEIEALDILHITPA